MRLMYALIYIILLALLCFPLGRLLVKIQFRVDRFPFRSYSFERKGKIYEKIKIRKWQSRIPDVSRMVPGIVPRKEISKRPDKDKIRDMLNETCVSELTHLLLCIAGAGIMHICPGAWGIVLFAVYVLLGNVPFIIVQRYNRPRLIKLMRTAEKVTAMQRSPEYKEKSI